jgi:hypothetical protein
VSGAGIEESRSMAIVHLTARLRPSVCGRLDRQHASWLFTRLRAAFPRALAVTLMPNHPHLIAVVDDVALAHLVFSKILGAFVRGVAWLRPVWEPFPPPHLIVGAHKILLAVRYVALNPTRAGLVDDPLSWYWSTHRDVVGATVDPWVTLERLRRYVPARSAMDAIRLHAYVSGDPSTDPRGTPFPASAADVSVPERPLAEILTAAASATRGSMDDHRRRGRTRTLFVWLAWVQGWTDPRRLADLCGTTVRTILEIVRRPRPAGLAAARLCLGDARLLLRPHASHALSHAARP